MRGSIAIEDDWRTIPDNAEVANPDFGKNEDSGFTPVPALGDARLAVAHGGQSCKAADADCQTTRRPGIGKRDNPDRR